MKISITLLTIIFVFSSFIISYAQVNPKIAVSSTILVQKSQKEKLKQPKTKRGGKGIWKSGPADGLQTGYTIEDDIMLKDDRNVDGKNNLPLSPNDLNQTTNSNSQTGDDFYTTTTTTGSFSRRTNLDIKVFPNPATHYLQINTGDVVGVSVEIINSLGQRSYFQNLNDLNNRIDITNYPKGNYFLKINTESGNITKKIIIQ